MKLFNILVHILTETNRHAGHADILREQLDGTVGSDAQSTALPEYGAACWKSHCAKIEQAARAADPANACHNRSDPHSRWVLRRTPIP